MSSDRVKFPSNVSRQDDAAPRSVNRRLEFLCETRVLLENVVVSTRDIPSVCLVVS